MEEELEYASSDGYKYAYKCEVGTICSRELNFEETPLYQLLLKYSDIDLERIE